MKIWRSIFGFLLLILVLLGIAISQLPDSNLHIIACDVGQGDAILAVYKNIQILTDGGPDDSVLNCLGKHLPFWDRRIELVVSTHPDADHLTGLVGVIKRYNVDTILINPIDPGTQVYEALKSAVGSRGVGIINPDYGMKLRLGMIYLDVLHPSRDFENTKTNNYSIVTILKYKEFEALLPGDVDQDIAGKIAEKWQTGTLEYIKVPHHGSKNGLTENLLKRVMPKVAVISVGKNNQWGFPNSEIIEMLEKYNVKILRTDEMGDIEIVTDGEKIWMNAL